MPKGKFDGLSKDALGELYRVNLKTAAESEGLGNTERASTDYGYAAELAGKLGMFEKAYEHSQMAARYAEQVVRDSKRGDEKAVEMKLRAAQSRIHAAIYALRRSKELNEGRDDEGSWWSKGTSQLVEARAHIRQLRDVGLKTDRITSVYNLQLELLEDPKLAEDLRLDRRTPGKLKIR